MDIGQQIHAFARSLWGINRSITGEGVRETLSAIQARLPNLKIHAVPSGTQVSDWSIPKEWRVRAAYIVTPSGERICDVHDNNLHLMGYSVPFRGKLTLSELQAHLYSLPNQPNAIPYHTAYYHARWGFCIAQNERDKLIDGEYEVVVDTELFDGVLNYGELIIPGRSRKEVLLSSYICHPSMANNELSGPTVLTFLAEWLLTLKQRNYTYRVIFVPETIGSITYISQNLSILTSRVMAGFNVSCVGDDRAYSFLPSRNGKTLSDDVAQHVLKWMDPAYVAYSWADRGSDERQYCAPGVDLPIASIMRTKYGEYPEYHTSLDDLDNVVTPEGLSGGYTALRRALEIIENNEKPKVRVVCEPQMGKRGLYPTVSSEGYNDTVRRMMDFISHCDGKHTLLAIAEKINVPCWDLYPLVDQLKENNLIDSQETETQTQECFVNG